jgi:hypothetical protein
MAIRSGTGFEDEAFVDGLAAWFREEPGSIVARIETGLLSRVLPDLFGYHLVQLGCRVSDALLASSRISHRVRINPGRLADPDAQMRSREDALPLPANSIDVLVLPHVLEFAVDPRRVLREAERVLIGEGHLVVLGFSPWSSYGLWSLACRWQRQPPWGGRFIAAARVRDWLQLLGFDIVHFERASFRPPMRRPALNRRLEFMEKLGAFCWPGLGNLYCVVGRKRVEGVTPLKASWRQRRRVVAGGMAEPSTRAPWPCDPGVRRRDG